MILEGRHAMLYQEALADLWSTAEMPNLFCASASDFSSESHIALCDFLSSFFLIQLAVLFGAGSSPAYWEMVWAILSRCGTSF